MPCVSCMVVALLERNVCGAWVSARQGPFQKFQSPGIEARMRLLWPRGIRLVFRRPNSELRSAGRPLSAVVLGSAFTFADSQSLSIMTTMNRLPRAVL